MNLLFDNNDERMSFNEYEKIGGFKALKKALLLKPDEIIKEITASNLVGRGGAGFPTGLKMSFVASSISNKKYIICNADEGEPGTFKDRELLRKSPLKVIEGMIIAAYAVGATKGFLYVRGEYANLKDAIKDALTAMKKHNYLGQNICNSNFNFDIEYRSGTGAYICGEETALIESIEGKSGDPRIKPPYTASEGLWGYPTLVNNVETLVNLVPIMELGAHKYKSFGTKESSGTKLFSVSGSVKNRGVYEVPFGTSLRSLIDDYCGGVEEGKKIKFIQVGGSSGSLIPYYDIDIELSYEAFKNINATLGSGAILVVDESICIVDFLKSTALFFKHESCGKCTPCREGNRHILRIIDNLSKGIGSEKDCETLLITCRVMKEASFCGLGQTAPTAVISAFVNYKDEIVSHINGKCFTGVCKFKSGGDN